MIKMLVDNKNIVMLSKDEKCYFCGGNISGSWAMFHGSIESNCCGAHYQIKDYHVEKPDEHKEEFELYTKGFVKLSVNEKYLIEIKSLFDNSTISSFNELTEDMLEE